MSLSVGEVAAERPDAVPGAGLPDAEPAGASGGARTARLRSRWERLGDRVPRRVHRILPDLTAFGAYLGVAIWVLNQIWRDPYTRISAHLPSDNILFTWWLTHAAHSLVHLQNPLFSTQMNVPFGVNMMANTSILGVSIPLIPVTLLFGPQVSYAVYVTLALTLSATTCYYVLSRYLVTSRVAAFVGAGFFGFAPGIIHHANGQPNFASNFLLPLIVLRVAKLREPGRSVRNGAILALLVGWQLFINEELLMLTAAGSVVFVLCYAIMRPRDARTAVRPFVLGGAVAVGVALPLLAYPIWFQFAGPQHYHGIPEVFNTWGEDTTAYFTFARDTVAGNPAVEQTIGATEQNSWFGTPLVALLVIIVVLMWRRSLSARIAAILGVGFSILALGPYLRVAGTMYYPVTLPWVYFQNLPLIHFMYPSRLIFVVIGCVTVLLALGGDRLSKVGAAGLPRPLRYVGVIGMAAALVPIIPTPIPGTNAPDVPAFIADGTWKNYVDSRHTLVTVPLANNTLGLKAIVWNTVARQEYAFPRGYFLGPDEKGIGSFGAQRSKTNELLFSIANSGKLPTITDQQRADARTELRSWRAAIVVLDPADPHADALWSAVSQLTWVSAKLVNGVWLWDVRSFVDAGSP